MNLEWFFKSNDDSMKVHKYWQNARMYWHIEVACLLEHAKFKNKLSNKTPKHRSENVRIKCNSEPKNRLFVDFVHVI